MGLFDLFKKKVGAPPIMPQTNLKTETHKIVGMQYRIDSIMKFATKNPDFQLDKKSIISKKLTGQRIWEYNFNLGTITLAEESTNPQDPNAVQVLANGVHIGYIKKGSCSHIKKLLHSGTIISISLEKFNYGKYKSVFESYEEGHFEMDKGSSDGYCEIKISYKEV